MCLNIRVFASIALTPANNVGDLVVTVRCMVDAVATAARRPAFETDDLLDQPRLIDKLDQLDWSAAAGRRRRDRSSPLARDLVADACLAKWFARPFTGVAITGRPLLMRYSFETLPRTARPRDAGENGGLRSEHAVDHDLVGLACAIASVMRSSSHRSDRRRPGSGIRSAEDAPAMPVLRRSVRPRPV